MKNPYGPPFHLWTPEALRAWNDMPKTHNGYNAGFVELNREAWRAWMQRTPKDLWHPVCIQEYQNLDRIKAQK